jgi:hypothetical protein
MTRRRRWWVLDRANGGDPPHPAPALVPREDRRGLLPVGPKPGGHRGGVVVGTALDRPPPRQPVEDLFVADVEKQHRVHPALLLRQNPLQPLGLRDGPHDAVEDHALRRLGLAQFLAHHSQDDVVADQVAGLHHRLGLAAQRAIALHGVTQQVAGSELGEA